MDDLIFKQKGVAELIPDSICRYIEIDGEYDTCIRLHDVVDLIKEILNQKFFEQRQICADNAILAEEGCTDFDDLEVTIDKNSILNAPEPEL